MLAARWAITRLSVAALSEQIRGPERQWRKLGLRVVAPGTGLMRTHAMLPTPLADGARMRVLFSSCDDELRGRVFAATLDNRPPYPVVSIEQNPVLDLGPPGAFDADGVNPTCLVRRGSDLLLAYVGWKRGPPDRPYTLTAGMALSSDDGRTFAKLGQLLPLTAAEPLFRTAAFVFEMPGGWGVLYIGGDRFAADVHGKRLPVYSLRFARSSDGYSWPDHGVELMAPDLSQGEIGFGRPVLFGDGNDTRLMLSIRTTDGYRLCSTRWDSGRPIKADLAPMLEPGREGWDATSTCFGAIHRVGGEDLLLYNGNEFGRTGFGLAIGAREMG